MYPRKILIINHEYPPVGGGAATVTEELLKRLVVNNIEVALLTGEQPAGSMKKTDHAQFPIFRVKSGRQSVAKGSYREFVQFFIGSLFVLPKIRKQFRPDMVLAFFTIPGGLTALIQKWLYKTEYVVSIRGGDIPGFEMSTGLNFFHWLLRPVIRLVCLNAREVHVNSQRLKDLTEKLIPERDITVIPNGVRMPRVTFPERRKSDKIQFLFVGRLSSQKNLPTFLKGFARLSPECRKACNFTIVGDGPENKSLQTLVRNTGLTEQVTFTGWISREVLSEYYLNHQVLVLPSLDEGMSNTALEALAHGCALLSSERGALNWSDTRLKNYWIVKEHLIPERWTERLEQIILHADIITEDAIAMHTYVKNQFAWEKLIPEYLQLFSRMNYRLHYCA